MRVEIQFPGYNDKRYSKPWIARVVAWATGQQPMLNFGSYVGDASGGAVEIEATLGQVIKYGQKDYRGNGTVSKWGVVNENGEVTPCTAGEARKAFNATV